MAGEVLLPRSVSRPLNDWESIRVITSSSLPDTRSLRFIEASQESGPFTSELL